ncbi:MAG: ABC transporter ATP-binding protein, partial [Selenomonadaceae bacterium]
MKNYKRLLLFMKPYLPRLGIAVVCIILAAAANLYVPWIIKNIIDDVLTTRDMVMLNTIAVGIV